MLYIDNSNTNPPLNLAMEEHILRHIQTDEAILFFYINQPAVIIGRNQNTAEEIDPDYIKEQSIHVVRRLSGGGAVYHDLGNLNFSFVTQAGPENFHNFARFTEPVIQVLTSFGINAELKEHSSIFANGRKISGNAQYSTSKRMFSHGTLLFDTNIEHMLKALNPRQAKIESTAVQSVRNFVANIRELLPQEMDIQQLKQAILQGVFGSGEIPTYDLTEEDWQQIRQLAAARYNNWEWNYGRSPRFNIQKSGRSATGKIDVRLNVEQGRIKTARIYGDFTGTQDIRELQTLLIGVRHNRDDLAAALHHTDLAPYFGPLELDAFLDLLY